MKWKAVRFWSFVLVADVVASLVWRNAPWWQIVLIALGIYWIACQIMERP